MEKNPCIRASVPKHTSEKREIWEADALMHAREVCEDEREQLAFHLAFACSLRIGEILGLTWDCVDITPKAIEEDRAYIYINNELQRVRKAASGKFFFLRQSHSCWCAGKRNRKTKSQSKVKNTQIITW